MTTNSIKIRPLTWVDYLVTAVQNVVVAVVNNIGEAQKARALADASPEYWLAEAAKEETKQAEAAEETKRYQAKLEVQERLEMDKRDRLSSPDMTAWTRDSVAEHMKSVG